MADAYDNEGTVASNCPKSPGHIYHGAMTDAGGYNSYT